MFIVSKIVGFLIHPLNAAIVLVAIGLLLGFVGRRRLATAVGGAGLAVLFLASWTSLGALLIGPLEDRFQRPDPAPATVAGIVVLGGGMEGAINKVRGGYELSTAGDRFVEAAVLARRYPEARIVVTGGTGSLLLDGEGDADTAPRLLEALGVAPDRLILENKSRNTDENARFTRDLVSPKAGETWLLVTSAFHMPRSMGLFRKAGFAVVPWPVDYRTSGSEGIGLFRDNESDALANTAVGIREWTGLASYFLLGRIDSVLPAP